MTARPRLSSACALALLVALPLGGCRARTGAQDISSDTFEDPPPGSYPPVPLPVDSISVSARHPTGLTIEITRLAFEPDRMGAHLRIGGSDTRALTLNKYGKMHLQDDVGNHYAVVPPEGNKDLTIGARARLDSIFVFEGGLAEQARTLTLVTNDGPGGESNLTDQPKLRVGPIPVTRPDSTD